ncbi:MAG: hypothetical protein EOP11_12540 [Proteobacteria bacterium]|nr:MAG: hypothetical protein EOP11_12540 [Pseudomonadota bacterium]
MLQLPVIEGTLDRRILLNYTLDPDYLKTFLPSPFKPRLYKGMGVGGVCMIRFAALRPKHAPAFLGINSENAAHRIAVEWEANGSKHEGVYIPKRSTASAFNYLAGGRFFPGVFQKSEFQVSEEGANYQLIIQPEGAKSSVVSFSGEVSPRHHADSVFPTLEEASEFFAKGAVGYSRSRNAKHFEGMELRLLEWRIEPMKVNGAAVELFENGEFFPKGTTKLDSAMLMRNLRHEWHRIPELPA